MLDLGYAFRRDFRRIPTEVGQKSQSGQNGKVRSTGLF